MLVLLKNTIKALYKTFLPYFLQVGEEILFN